MAGEIIIDAKRNRSWPRDLKRQIVAESYTEGVSVCEVARRYDLEPSQLFHWRKQFRDASDSGVRARQSDGAGFFPVEIAMSETVDDGEPSGPMAEQAVVRSARIEIAFPNGRRLFIAPALERNLLNALIAAVAGT